MARNGIHMVMALAAMSRFGHATPVTEEADLAGRSSSSIFEHGSLGSQNSIFDHTGSIICGPNSQTVGGICIPEGGSVVCGPDSTPSGGVCVPNGGSSQAGSSLGTSNPSDIGSIVSDDGSISDLGSIIDPGSVSSGTGGSEPSVIDDSGSSSILVPGSSDPSAVGSASSAPSQTPVFGGDDAPTTLSTSITPALPQPTSSSSGSRPSQGSSRPSSSSSSSPSSGSSSNPAPARSSGLAVPMATNAALMMAGMGVVAALGF